MAKQARILIAALAAVIVAVGLYLLNKKWIAPVTAHPADVAGNHPSAPEIIVTDIHGQPLKLSDYRGKVVLLDFWATWCGPCRIEIPGFIEMQARYRDQGLAVVGISMDDSADPVKDFYQQFNMNYPVAVGDEKIAEAYGGILGLPTTFVIGRDGRIYSKHTGATDVAVFEAEVKKLLATKAESEADNFEPAGNSEVVDLGTPGEHNAEVPGVDISGLNPTQLAAFKKQLAGESCTCGCKLDLLKCRQDDRACSVSRKLAKEHLRKFQSPQVMLHLPLFPMNSPAAFVVAFRRCPFASALVGLIVA